MKRWAREGLEKWVCSDWETGKKKNLSTPWTGYHFQFHGKHDDGDLNSSELNVNFIWFQGHVWKLILRETENDVWEMFIHHQISLSPSLSVHPFFPFLFHSPFHFLVLIICQMMLVMNGQKGEGEREKKRREKGRKRRGKEDKKEENKILEAVYGDHENEDLLSSTCFASCLRVKAVHFLTKDSVISAVLI